MPGRPATVPVCAARLAAAAAPAGAGRRCRSAAGLDGGSGALLGYQGMEDWRWRKQVGSGWAEA